MGRRHARVDLHNTLFYGLVVGAGVDELALTNKYSRAIEEAAGPTSSSVAISHASMLVLGNFATLAVG